MTTTEHEQTENTEDTPLEPQDATETPSDAPEAPEDDNGPDEAAETFPREYVQKLRDESAKYRTRAQRADDLARRLHTALTAATGKLADPSDLPYSEDHLEDPEALTAAVDALLTAKPHLAARRPRGNVGQGNVSSQTDTVDLAGILRARA